MGENNTYGAGRAVRRIKAEVIFGKLSHDCRGVGICKVDVKGYRRTGCQHCKHKADADILLLSDNTVVFRFDRSRLSRNVFTLHLSRDEFIVPETFHFKPDVLRIMGLEKYSIRAGVYPIKGHDKYFEICFPLTRTVGKNIPVTQYLIRRRSKTQQALH